MGCDRQIFFSGTWQEGKATAYGSVAFRIGEMIAESGFSLSCGPGTGIARHALDGFRSVDDRVGVVRFYLPAVRHMLAVGEEVQEGWDEIVRTDFDYPMRNVFQVSKAVGLVVVTGGDGTLEEILPALVDYGIPVGVLRGSGQAAVALETLLDVFPVWQENTLVTEDPEELAKFVLTKSR